MTTSHEREQILNEYGAWVEQKTLAGLDLSVEAYLEDMHHKDDINKLAEVEAIVGNFEDLEESPERWSRFLNQLDQALYPEKERTIRELD